MPNILWIVFLPIWLWGCASKMENKSFDETISDYRYEIKDLLDEFSLQEGGVVNFKPAMDYYGLSETRVKELRAGVFESSIAKLSHLNPQGESIPLITHRMWITPNHAPHEAPEIGLTRYIESVRFLKDKGNYTHYFWCLDKSKIPLTLARLKNSEVGHLIKIRELKEIEPKIKGLKTIKLLIRERYFVAATDFIRTNLVFLFGGIYTDLPWTFKTDITPLLRNYDYLVRITKEGPMNLYLDKNLLAAKKGDASLGQWLRLMDNFTQIPLAIRKQTPSMRPQLEWVLAGYTSLFPALIREGALLMPISNTLVESHHFGSWNNHKTSIRFGNSDANESPLDLFQLNKR